MRHRFTAIILTLSLIGGIIMTTPGTFASADGTSSSELIPAESIKADVDKVKFTDKEWTGTDYTDVDGNSVSGEDVFGIAREDAASTRIPYQDVASAQNAVWDYNARGNSEYFKLLTGENEDWQLLVVDTPSEASTFVEDGFMTSEYSTADHGTNNMHFSRMKVYRTGYDNNNTTLYPTAFRLANGDGTETLYFEKDEQYTVTFKMKKNADIADTYFSEITAALVFDSTYVNTEENIRVWVDGGQTVTLTTVDLTSDSDWVTYTADITVPVSGYGAFLLYAVGGWIEVCDIDVDNITLTPIANTAGETVTVDFENDQTAFYTQNSNRIGGESQVYLQRGWSTVQLPKSWTMQGFDYSIYANIRNPWNNASSEDRTTTVCPEAPAATDWSPVGLYRKTFTVDDTLFNSSRRVYIHFQGVESAYYIYVNGKEVGYSEDTYAPHYFDITDYLVKGENLLAVKVHRFCDGQWFEDQDMIYDGGIFRDVYLTSEPLVQIADYTVTTDLDDAYTNAELNISVDVKNLSSVDHSGWSVKVQATDETGDIISGFSIPVSNIASTDKATFSGTNTVIAPKLWSAEKPNLYALTLTLCDAYGTEVEILSTQLGFREIEFTSTQVDENYNVITTEWDPITINGKKLLLKGVNRHDSDPFYGKAAPQATMLEDVMLMKQNNINAVRTSHYSNDDYFYWLCNSYGLYMMGETNLESHSLRNNNISDATAIQYQSDCVELFNELMIDRTETALKWLKNNPAIVIWSLGNEMSRVPDYASYGFDHTFGGGIFPELIWYYKNNDPTRPVHAEFLVSSFGVDMEGGMYPSVSKVQNMAGKGKMPYVAMEYVHGMGNSGGSYKEYLEAFRSADNMLGGFAWDWVDQSRAVELPNGGWDYYSEQYAHTNLYSEEIKGKFYGYGSDWGDTPPDTAFSQNGLLSADRDPQPELSEVKYQYQDIWFSADFEEIAARTINVYNENSFTNLNEYDVTWQLLENGFVIDSGTVSDTDIAPHTTGTVNIPFTMPENIPAGSEYFLNISVSLKNDTLWAEKGAELSYAQIEVPAEVEQSAPVISQSAVTVTETDTDMNVEGNNFAFSVDKSTGVIKNYSYGSSGKTALKGRFTVNDVNKVINDAITGSNGFTVTTRVYIPDSVISTSGQKHSPIFALGDNSFVCRTYSTTSETRIDAFVKDSANKWPTIRYVIPDSSFYNNWHTVTVTYNNNVLTLYVDGTSVGTVTTASAPLNNGKMFSLGIDPDKSSRVFDEYTYEYVRIFGEALTVDELNSAASPTSENVVLWMDLDVEDGLIKDQSNNALSTELPTTAAFVVGESGEDLETLLESGPAPNFWRAKLDNDKGNGYDINWEGVEKNITVNGIAVSKNDSGQTVITVDIIFPDAGNTRETIVYTVNGNGEITVNMTVDATESGMGNFIRVGSMMTLPKGFEDVTWYGNGPVETFNDRKTNARQGIYASTVNEFFYPFLRVDDCGTLTDVKWISVKNPDSKYSLLVSATDTVEASALHFTPDMLGAANHVYKLSPLDETVLSINYGSLGTGSNSCGPAPLEQYWLPSSTVYNWEFTIIPISSSTTAEDLSKTAKAYHTVESFSYEDYYANLIIDLSNNKINTPLPDTAQYVTDENGGYSSITGYFSVNDVNKVINDAITGSNGFTVTTRVYIPDSVISTSGQKHSPIFALGDNSFVCRTYSTTSETRIDAFVKDSANKWPTIRYLITDSSFYNNWHTVTVTYNNNVLTLYVDGTSVGTVTTASAPLNNGKMFSLGIDPDMSSRVFDEYTYEYVRIFGEALTVDELETATSPEADNVVLWMDFDNKLLTEQPKIGDVNNDGEVDLRDLVRLKKILVKIYNETASSDINGDGTVDALDATELRKILLS